MRYSLLLLVVALLFNGCFKKEISCNDPTVRDLVHKLSMDTATDTIALTNLKKDKDKASMLLLIGMSCQKANTLRECFKTLGMVDALSKNKNFSIVSKLKKITNYDEISKEIKNAPFALKDILTQKKDKELQKVECKATAIYTLSNHKYTYDVDYTAQYTDDGKKVYVELKHIKLREIQ